MKLYYIKLGFDAENAPEDLEFHIVAKSMSVIEERYKDVEEIKLIDDMVVIITEIGQ
jgi:hypothetical protein